MKKLFILLFCVVFIWCVRIDVFAEERWCAVSDSFTIVLDNVDCLVSTDGEENFSILLKDGSFVKKVYSLTFEKKDFSGESIVPCDAKSTDIMVMHNMVRISNAASGLTAKIFDLSGNALIATEIKDGECDLDISSFAQGVYVLNIGDNSIKFVKK